MIHDIEMSRAIENSIKEAGIDVASFEPFNPGSLKRKSGLPVGLKNIGNTCYFNSLIQTYFMIPSLVEEILKYSPHPSHLAEESKEEANMVENVRKKASIALVEALKNLFGFLTCSNRKYIDPVKVLSSIVDDFANQIRVGEQKDVGEFHLILVARIEEGLRTKLPLGIQEDQHEGSPIKRNESANFTGLKINETSLMSQLFYGKQREYLSVKGGASPIINEVVFGQIILDVEEKDLYSAWDASYFCEIEDYLLENHGTTQASQEIWPERFPNVLLFQIQRVKYDRTVNSSVKINSKFTFPHEIFSDRFLKENREESLKLRQEMLRLKHKARYIEAEIEKFVNFKGSGMSLETILDNTLLFLNKQENPSSMDCDGSSDPDCRLIQGIRLEDSPQVLSELKIKVGKRLMDLNNELKEVYFKLKMLYDVPMFRRHQYKLHSLLVHDGYAGSGHYYTFVHDFQHNVWRKYSDLAIEVVPLEKVIEDSEGGNGFANAYCLFYIKSENIETQSVPYWDFNIDQVENTHYFNLVPENIRKDIKEDNLKLEDEIVSFNSTQEFTKIANLYESKIASIEKIYNENNNNGENIRFALINFPFFLRVNDNELKCKFLLHECYKQIMGHDLNDLKWGSPLFSKLEIAYKNKLTLTPQDKEKIKNYSERFREINSCAEVLMVLVKNMIEVKIENAFKLILFNYELNNLDKDDISTKIKEYINVLAIMALSHANLQVQVRNLDDALVFASIAGHLMVHLIDSQDIIFRILMQRFDTLAKEYSKCEDLRGFLEHFNEIIAGIKDRSIIAHVSFEEITEECSIIRKKKEEFDSYHENLATGENDIAVRFAKSKSVQDAGLKQWVKLHEDLRRTRTYSERLFKDVEQKLVN